MELRARGRQREPKNSRLCLVLPPSRPPCKKISIVQSGPDRNRSFCDLGCGLAAKG